MVYDSWFNLESPKFHCIPWSNQNQHRINELIGGPEHLDSFFHLVGNFIIPMHSYIQYTSICSWYLLVYASWYLLVGGLEHGFYVSIYWE